MNKIHKMNNDFEEKRKKKILDNGKNNVQSVYSMGPFTVLPRRAFNDKRMCKHPTTLLILGTLCTCANNFTGVCFPTYQYIMNATNKSLKTISHSINHLIDWGYVKRLRKGSPLYKNVRHKSSIYRILYDPSASDNEVHSRALHNDPELQQIERDKTLQQMEKTMKKETKKTPTFSPEVKEDFNIGLNRIRLTELDSNKNTISNNKNIKKMSEIEMMNEFKAVHREVFNIDFIPDRRDWNHIKDLWELNIGSNILFATIKRNFHKKDKPPAFPLSWILKVMNDDPETPQSVVAEIAKLLKRKRRNYD